MTLTLARHILHLKNVTTYTDIHIEFTCGSRWEELQNSVGKIYWIMYGYTC